MDKCWATNIWNYELDMWLLDKRETKGIDVYKADEVDTRIQELEEDIHALIGYSPRHCIDCVIDIDGVCTCGLNKLMAKYTAAEALKDT